MRRRPAPPDMTSAPLLLRLRGIGPEFATVLPVAVFVQAVRQPTPGGGVR